MILDQPIKKWFVNEQGKDSNVKSFMKSISWRIGGILDTMVISLFVIYQPVKAKYIGSIEVFT